MMNPDRKRNPLISGCKALALLPLLVLLVVPVHSQSVSAVLKVDSTHILIGDPLNVQLTVKYTKDLQVAVPKPADTLGNLEVISHSAMDTTAENNQLLLTQSFTVSAYDSGDFHAGPLRLYFKNASGAIDSVLSNTIPIAVQTLDVDTAQPIKPIKAPLEVPYSWREFLYYFLAIGLLLLLILAAYLLWKRHKRQPKPTYERPKPKDPAHVWARKELRKLEEEKLWQQDEVKRYYSRLTDILRLYLEYRYGWTALESTTEEIEAEMSNYPMNDVAKKLLLEVLRNADLVKFARLLPMPDTNVKSLEQAFNFIDVTAAVESKADEQDKK